MGQFEICTPVQLYGASALAVPYSGMGKAKRPRDTNQLAKLIVDVATGEVEDIGPEKAEAQRKGGLKGGRARAEALTPSRRQEIARTGIRKRRVEGNPDLAHVSTSYVERNNLTMRMSMRRFTRLTNVFSKKIENHTHSVALHFMYYNFCRQHKSLDGISPAMAAGVTDRLWDIEDIVRLIDEAAPKPGPRSPYKKRNSN